MYEDFARIVAIVQERRIAMLRFHPSRFGWILVLTLGSWAVAAQAQEFRYHYVSLLNQVELPPGFTAGFFDPIAINNSGRIYGIAYDDSYTPYVAVYTEGALTVLQPGIVYAANERGTIGGSVLIDSTNFIEQAALFHGDQVELIPPQPGEFTSFVTALNDSGMALVTSYDASYQPTYVLYKNGQATPLDFRLTITQPFDFLHINSQGIISGTAFNLPGIGTRGFRFDTRTGETTLLNPLPTEPDAWALDINNRSDVLGYSFVAGGIERVGVWDREAEFKTYFVEGIPEFPTISNWLRFNDNNLIVITYVLSPAAERLKNSYLVPKPGVRLNLADLVENLPPQQNVSLIININNHGDMIGYSAPNFAIKDVFLLERMDTKGAASSAAANTAHTSSSDMENGQHAIPAAAATILRRHMPPPYASKSGTALPQSPLESLLLQLP
jgi:hypothetical protein